MNKPLLVVRNLKTGQARVYEIDIRNRADRKFIRAVKVLGWILRLDVTIIHIQGYEMDVEE